jgi:hypothetical protein
MGPFVRRKAKRGSNIGECVSSFAINFDARVAVIAD